jgi:uncharacterized protein YecT (DUF1311 family)
MKLLLAALLTLACLAPTFANEPGYTPADEQAMQLCVETVNDINNDPNPGDTVTLAECISAASGLCQEAPEGSSTQGIVACNQREQAWWDEYLNSMYDSLHASLEPDVFETLKGAQLAWIAYRDAKCAFVDALNKGGTIRQVMSSQCLMDTTATRAIELADAVSEQN